MNKKRVRRLLLLLVVLLLAAAWSMSYKKYREKAQLKEAYQTRPELSIYAIAEDTIEQAFLYDDMYTVMVFFNSHCDFCKLELYSFKKHKDEIENIQFAFISAESVDTLRALKEGIDFSGIVEAGIYHAKAEEVRKYYGKFGIPSMFIYDADNKLIKEFQGFTRIDDLLTVIHEKRAEEIQ